MEIKLFMFLAASKKAENDDVKAYGGEKGCAKAFVMIYDAVVRVRTEQMVGNALSVDGSVE